MEFPAINGYAPSWASVECGIAGDITPLIKEIKYSNKRDRGMGRGSSGRKVLRTKGDDDPSASMVLYKGAWDTLVEKLGDGFQDVEFPITVSYTENGVTKTDTLERALIDEPEGGGAEGNDPSEVSVGLNIMDILWNGKRGRKLPTT
jgi:hypothetical protein